MNIPSLTIDELNALDNYSFGIRGRDPAFGLDFICQVAPNSKVASTCREIIVGSNVTLSYKELSLIDITGSLDAGTSLLEWIFDGVDDWSMYVLSERDRARANGTCHFSFELPGVCIRAEAWTPYAALMRAIVSGIRWEVEKECPCSLSEEEWNRRYQPSFKSGGWEEIPLDEDGNWILPADIERTDEGQE